jgi:hypothetical protein
MVLQLKLMNKALLCKWLWKYHNSEHKGLWKDIIRCRYHNRRTLINASPFWKEINKEILIFKIIDNGTTISFWQDR